MADRGGMTQRPVRAPVGRRQRRRWIAAAAIALLWLFLLSATGSWLLATVALVVLAALAGTTVMGLRWLGVGAGHPWVRRLATRPWRDGRDVLNTALRHLPEVFIVTPGKTLLAPNAVELLMNTDDVASLCELIDIGLVNSSAAECYEAEVAAHAARLASAGPVQVSVIGDPAIPAGRYRLRRGQLAHDDYPRAVDYPPADVYPRAVSYPQADSDPGGGYPGGGYPGGGGYSRADDYQAGPFYPYVHDGSTSQAPAQAVAAQAATVQAGLATVAEPVLHPALRLVTNGSVAETRVSGARAGRSQQAELQLPEEPTVSRLHAEFTYRDGEWWITNRGLNGLQLNGTPLDGEHVIRAGDLIRWGRQNSGLTSRIEIG